MRRRIGSNDVGGILGLIDANQQAPLARRSSNARASSSAAKASAQSSNASSSAAVDDSSQVNTPPPKAILFSNLAGSPVEGESVGEEDLSDLSPGSHEDEQSPASNYSLKPRPLFKDETDPYGGDNESIDESEELDSDISDEDCDDDEDVSATLSTMSKSEPSVNTTGASSSIEDELIDEDESSLDSEAASDEDVDEDVEEEADTDDESDDEYVVEESSTDTEDEELEEDVDLETPMKQKSGRHSKQSQKAADAKEPIVQESKQPEDDEKVNDAEKNKSSSSVVKREINPQSMPTKTRRGRPRKQDKTSSFVQEKGAQRNMESEVANDTKQNESNSHLKMKKTTSLSMPMKSKRGRPQKQAKQVVFVEKAKEETNGSKSPVKKKESIYQKQTMSELSAEEEMIVVAQVLEGTHLDDEDDDVVIAEILSDGDSSMNDDVVAIVLDDSVEGIHEDINKERNAGVTSCVEGDDAESFSDEVDSENRNEDTPFTEDDMIGEPDCNKSPDDALLSPEAIVDNADTKDEVTDTDSSLRQATVGYTFDGGGHSPCCLNRGKVDVVVAVDEKTSVEDNNIVEPMQSELFDNESPSSETTVTEKDAITDENLYDATTRSQKMDSSFDETKQSPDVSNQSKANVVGATQDNASSMDDKIEDAVRRETNDGAPLPLETIMVVGADSSNLESTDNMRFDALSQSLHVPSPPGTLVFDQTNQDGSTLKDETLIYTKHREPTEVSSSEDMVGADRGENAQRFSDSCCATPRLVFVKQVSQRVVRRKARMESLKPSNSLSVLVAPSQNLVIAPKKHLLLLLL